MFCNKCGTQLQENAKFCSVCGTPISVNQPAQPEPVQQQPAVDPFSQPTPVQPAVDPFSQPTPVQPVADPYAQATPVQPVADPYSQPTPVQPVADPYAQSAPVQPVTDSYAQATPVQPVADPYAQSAPVQPVIDPYAQSAPMQQESTYAQPAQQWGPMMQPEKKNKSGKAPLIIGLLCGVLAIVVVLIVVLLFACSGGGASSPEEAAEAYFKALNEKDFNDLKDIMYPPIFNAAYDEDIYEKDEFVEKIALSGYPDRYYLDDGDVNITFSNVKVTDKENVSSSRIETYNSSLKKQDGYITISKAADIEGTVIIKAGSDSKEYDFEAVVVLADGDWYIADIDLD